MENTKMDIDLELDAELEAELLADLPTTTDTTTTTTTEKKAESTTALVGDEEVDRFEALPRPSALFLHGVDEMSTAEITAYVDSPLLTKVEWINDSSCNLAFKDANDAKAVAQTLMSQPVDLDHRTLVAAKPFKEFTLSIRMSTDEDCKERGSRARSRYYLLHGVEGQPISEERREARKEHLERMKKNGGDGRDVFSRLGQRREDRRSRDRSLSPSREPSRSTRRERSVEREIPQHLKSRLGPIKTEETEIKEEGGEPETTENA